METKKIKTEITAEATASLKKEVEEELKVADPVEISMAGLVKENYIGQRQDPS